MEWMELHCRLESCEIDGTQIMDTSKCLTYKGKFQLCRQLSIKKQNSIQRGAVWDKLGEIIKRQKPDQPKKKDDFV